ncbi:uncharacterized protein LOC126657213 [Mercurialis annua]|uniref:uncharacterized protein LOC126657213 n=1 Tax=Mercurialis annua TaxID=3986 RepID=UPI00215FF204|nr:uncharacterized protein LOC126657213 [Mercurialis annua]
MAVSELIIRKQSNHEQQQQHFTLISKRSKGIGQNEPMRLCNFELYGPPHQPFMLFFCGLPNSNSILITQPHNTFIFTSSKVSLTDVPDLADGERDFALSLLSDCHMGEVTSGVPNPSTIAVPNPTPDSVNPNLDPASEEEIFWVSIEEAPRFAAWADAQNPPRLSNVAILHACMENIMIKEDIESIDREHGDSLAEFACLGGFSVVQSIAVLERRRRDAVDQLKKLQRDSESWLSEKQKMEEEAGEATGLIQQLRSSVSTKTREISALEARVRTLSEEVESLQSSSGALTKERDDLKKEEGRLRRRLGDSGSFYSQVMTQYRLAIGAKLREQNPGVDLSGVNQLDPASLAKEVKAKLDKQKQDALNKA